MRFVYKVGIIAVFASIFLMSHNVSALPVNYDLSGYEMISSFTPQVQCTYKTASSLSSAWTCPINGGDALRIIKTVNNYSFSKDDIITADLVIYNSSNYTGQSLYISFPYTVPGNNFELLDFSLINDSSVYVDVPSSPILQGVDVYRVYSVAFLSTATSSRTIGFWPTGNYNNFLEYVGASQTEPIQVRLYNFKVWRRTKTQVNKEQEQATQDAADESETEAQDNSTNSQTTNLIGAFQSFVSALTSLNATNCNVNLPFPSALGGNMQVNICQNKDYAGNIVSVFGSLTLIVFYIPFSLKLLSMIYNEIRSFTNG